MKKDHKNMPLGDMAEEAISFMIVPDPRAHRSSRRIPNYPRRAHAPNVSRP